MTADEYAELMHSPFVDERLALDETPLIVVTDVPSHIPSPGALPVVVATLGESGAPEADVVIDHADVAALDAAVAAHPLAATALVTLLRWCADIDPEAGLAAESAVYSTLQGGPEFARWRAGVTPSPATDDGPTVLTERDGNELTIRLHRPARHNALSAAMRDELCAALHFALADDSITHVYLRGDGPSFCSGGDLHEFGARPDPATAHHTRLLRSPARLLHRLAPRTTAHLHGATFGGGIEMAAYAGHVVAAADTRIALPELNLGLIPGAGGTVSLTRRIGRQRTAWLALTGREIDAATALQWGLIDAVLT